MNEGSDEGPDAAGERNGSSGAEQTRVEGSADQSASATGEGLGG